MNDQTVKFIEALAGLATTQVIAKEFDAIIAEIGNISTGEQASAELVACVIYAQLRSGKGHIINVN